LRTVVLALPCYLHSESVPVELQTCFCLRNDESRVIYSQKQLAARNAPLWISLVWRKPQHFERMAVRIAEIERANSAGVLVPCRQELRAGRRMLHLVLAQPLVGAIHISHDDGDVLEPSVVAASIDWRGPSSRREELREFDVLFTEAHPRRPRPKTKHAGKALVVLTVHLGFRDLLKIQ